MTTEPTRSIEVERKYDVSEATGLPGLASLPGVVGVQQPELRSLDAIYFDTAGLALARRAVALRRRTGGPDEGWHVKSTAPEGRHEWGWPLGEALSSDPLAAAVPDDVRSSVTEWCGEEELRPIARVRNERQAILLQDASGAVIGEFVDDHVQATDLQTGVATNWREWEVELGPAAPADETGRADFFAAVDAAVDAVGGVPAVSGSKLQRALGR
ncbi:CYTH domain-containing protein [Microbacterium sp.]|uniref:CYTH domain-containing protein n=1 Tax=Microbacterium sp. TaxID=51671 RepID=UPI0037C91A4A